jgi:hypothetical protein
VSGVTITRRGLLSAGAATTGLFLLAGGTQLLRSEPSPFKVTMTTLFWVGEPSNAENAFIPNDQSYWDKDWQDNYGGVDDPERRNRHWPSGFTPRQNPFYVALPYGEFTEHGDALKNNAPRHVPWDRSGLDPLLKNHWVEIRRNGRSCFAQWQDVGPCGEDDFDLCSAGRASRATPSMRGQAWMSRRRFGTISACTTMTSRPGASSRRRTFRQVLGPKSSPRSAIIAEAAAPGQRPIRPAATPACGRQRRSRASGSRAALSPPHHRPIG